MTADMDILIIILIVVAVLIVGGLGYVALQRGRGPELSAPPREKPIATTPTAPDVEDESAALDTVEERVEEVVEEAPPKATFFSRLTKARSTMAGYLGSILSRSGIDAETWDELEEALIRADVGVQTSAEVLETLKATAKEQDIKEPAALLDALKDQLKADIGGRDISLSTDAGDDTAVWLFVGVNGVGKTTTIGKLAKREVGAGKDVVMAAGDTFRAAAAEQLEMWSERAGASIIRGAEGADPSSVIFDAVEHGHSRGVDVVMADTAGRLHNKSNLMDELIKVRRVAEKGAGTVTEALLVIDATTGQNGLVQAKVFTEAVELTGVVLTKLDGSAKGGIVMAVQQELGIPVKLVGLGEGPEDLIEFDADQFVDALLSTDE